MLQTRAPGKQSSRVTGSWLSFASLGLLFLFLANCTKDPVSPQPPDSGPTLNSGMLVVGWTTARILPTGEPTDVFGVEGVRKRESPPELHLKLANESYRAQISHQDWDLLWETFGRAIEAHPRNRHGCPGEMDLSEGLYWFSGDAGDGVCILGRADPETESVRQLFRTLVGKYLTAFPP